MLEMLRLLCEPMSNLITRSMTDSDLQGVAESVDRTKCRAFSLLRLLVSGHPPAQNTAMKHFTQLVSISGKGVFMLPWRIVTRQSNYPSGISFTFFGKCVIISRLAQYCEYVNNRSSTLKMLQIKRITISP